MKKQIKIFIFGLVVGGGIAFMLGINYGRGQSLLSNPFKERSLAEKVIRGTDRAFDKARAKIHEATKPDEPSKPAKK